MPFRRFIPYDVLGAGLWATTFIMIGYVFWQSFGRVLKIAKEGALGLGIAITRDRRRRLARALAARRREPRAARARARRARSTARACACCARSCAGRAGPLRFFIGRLTPGQLGLELTTLLAIAAVGSFAFFGYWIADRAGRRQRRSTAR